MVFPSGSRAKICETFHACYIPHPPPFYHPNILWWRGTKRVASLCIISAPPPPLKSGYSPQYSVVRLPRFFSEYDAPCSTPFKGRVVLKFRTSSGVHYGVQEVTVSCHISGSHSGGVAESCVLGRHFVSSGLYRYAPHNDVSVNDGPHIQRWSHNIIILLISLCYNCLQYSVQ